MRVFVTAVHLLDAAPLYRLALEKGSAGARYHAVAEEGVPVREIAEAIGRGLKVPVVSISPGEAGEHFGWLGFFAGADLPASSAKTQEWLGWRPEESFPCKNGSLGLFCAWQVLRPPC